MVIRIHKMKPNSQSPYYHCLTSNHYFSQHSKNISYVARINSGQASDIATEGPTATHLSPKLNESQKPGPSYLLGPHVCPSC